MATEADDAVTDPQPFVPILTVMADYGNAPFLWRINAPGQVGIGGNVCDGTGWDEGWLLYRLCLLFAWRSPGHSTGGKQSTGPVRRAQP